MSASSRLVESPAGAEQLADALDRFTAALGPDKVLTEPAQLDEFRDPFSNPTWDDFTGSAVVLPTTVEEVQAVVRIANETGVPLWTHSTGRNNGYGGPAPRVKGSVIVSLRNMNKVLEIDEELGYAVVEPGVRWFDLYEAIKARDAKLMLSIADIGWGSVIGNTLEHGATYLPYGLDFQAQCGMEVVLPDGDLLRTGMGAMPGNKSWNLYRRGLGPTPDQMFMQSNLGIVTKMGVWLMPRARGRDAAVAAAKEGRRHRAGDGRPAHADDGRHHPHGPADHVDDPAGRRLLDPREVVHGRGPDPRGRHRRDGQGARVRALAHALRAVRRRGGRRPSLRPRSRRRSPTRSPGRRCGARSTTRAPSRRR